MTYERSKIEGYSELNDIYLLKEKLNLFNETTIGENILLVEDFLTAIKSLFELEDVRDSLIDIFELVTGLVLKLQHSKWTIRIEDLFFEILHLLQSHDMSYLHNDLVLILSENINKILEKDNSDRVIFMIFKCIVYTLAILVIIYKLERSLKTDSDFKIYMDELSLQPIDNIPFLAFKNTNTLVIEDFIFNYKR